MGNTLANAYFLEINNFESEQWNYPLIYQYSVQFSLGPQSCPTFFDPVDWSTLGFPVRHQLPELTQILVHRVGDAIQHTIVCPLLLLPLIFPSIRVFSNESILHIRWPKYWSCSFSISPSNECSGPQSKV